jgi:hypothetical protein
MRSGRYTKYRKGRFMKRFLCSKVNRWSFRWSLYKDVTISRVDCTGLLQIVEVCSGESVPSGGLIDSWREGALVIRDQESCWPGLGMPSPLCRQKQALASREGWISALWWGCRSKQSDRTAEVGLLLLFHKCPSRFCGRLSYNISLCSSMPALLDCDFFTV